MAKTGHVKLDALCESIKRELSIWKDGKVTVIGKGFKDRLDFLVYNDARYLLYKENANKEQDFEVYDDSKKNIKEIEEIESLLKEQKLYMDYFESIAKLDSKKVKESFGSIKSFFEEVKSKSMSEGQKNIMALVNLEESEDAVNKLTSKIMNIGKIEEISDVCFVCLSDQERAIHLKCSHWVCKSCFLKHYEKIKSYAFYIFKCPYETCYYSLSQGEVLSIFPNENFVQSSIPKV